MDINFIVDIKSIKKRFVIVLLEKEILEDRLEIAKQGDIKTFNELFQPYGSSLKSYLYRLLTNREDVEDSYHNTFIKAFEKIGTFTLR